MVAPLLPLTDNKSEYLDGTNLFLFLDEKEEGKDVSDQREEIQVQSRKFHDRQQREKIGSVLSRHHPTPPPQGHRIPSTGNLSDGSSPCKGPGSGTRRVPSSHLPLLTYPKSPIFTETILSLSYCRRRPPETSVQTTGIS